MVDRAPEPGHSEDDDDRSSVARGVQIASQIMGAAASLGVLAAGGFWLDRQLGWQGPLTAVGALIGGGVFFWQMLQLSQQAPGPRHSESRSGKTPGSASSRADEPASRQREGMDSD